ncbi:TetR/AcrR family transcriptional regulator [Actinacidiphila glaucinigra]|uniref:TetR/AcrR family transcriptional regulator n=1 Tax=Actinacidiphila glaucinigra TaxID=235986 RepID=UPI002DDA315F|nr:TetR/AcrR family transcriptional regulator [Actinacidiphila glaucinigra]WSD57808.1 TetR/AcrR family transcriptional regulator [Actinacidiphila glaucinigra]
MTSSTPASPVATATAAPTRERLLDAAAALFYREGVNIGIEALCRAAGVSKRSMYQLFTSKDDVLAASLDRAGSRYLGALLPAPEADLPPRERIMHVFERLESLSASSDYLGCPFLATAFELKDPEHPASVVARRYKDALTDFFREEARRGGAQDPDLLARQLTVAFDGSSSRVVAQAQHLGGLATATATALLDTAGMP